MVTSCCLIAQKPRLFDHFWRAFFAAAADLMPQLPRKVTRCNLTYFSAHIILRMRIGNGKAIDRNCGKMA